MSNFTVREDLQAKKKMYKSFQRYSIRTNNIARRVLEFKTPNEMVEGYFKRAS